MNYQFDAKRTATITAGNVTIQRYVPWITQPMSAALNTSLPEPVGPYAKMHALPPSTTLEMIGCAHEL